MRPSTRGFGAPARTRAHTHRHIGTHTNGTHTQADTHTGTHARTRTHARTHAHARTQAHAHTRTAHGHRLTIGFGAPGPPHRHAHTPQPRPAQPPRVSVSLQAVGGAASQGPAMASRAMTSATRLEHSSDRQQRRPHPRPSPPRRPAARRVLARRVRCRGGPTRPARRRDQRALSGPCRGVVASVPAPLHCADKQRCSRGGLTHPPCRPAPAGGCGPGVPSSGPPSSSPVVTLVT